MGPVVARCNPGQLKVFPLCTRDREQNWRRSNAWDRSTGDYPKIATTDRRSWHRWIRWILRKISTF